MKVLLVEDETLVRRFIRALIDWEDCGYTIVGEAANGEEAWEWLQQEQVDIVLTDIRMPLLDGFGLIERMNEADVPAQAVILSSYDDFDYVRTALQLQVSDYVHKATMTAPELIACLEKARGDWVKRQERRLADEWTGGNEESRKAAVRAQLLAMAAHGGEEAAGAARLRQQLGCWTLPFHAAACVFADGEAPEGKCDARADGAVIFACDETWVIAGTGDIRAWAETLPLEAVVYTEQPVEWEQWPEAYAELRQELALLLADRDVPLHYNALVRKAVMFMRERYMEELTLEAVSGHVHVSPSYFSRLFQKETGQTFTEYATKLRLQEAVRLLGKTDHAVYDIAERVGYRNARYFLKLFKETYGMTPTEYRSAQLEDKNMDT